LHDSIQLYASWKYSFSVPLSNEAIKLLGWEKENDVRVVYQTQI